MGTTKVNKIGRTTMKKDVLSKALGIASKIVVVNPIIPLLSTVLLESNNGNSRVASTNLEIGISIVFPSTGEEFRICTPAKTMSGLIDSIDGEEVELEIDEGDQSVIITSDTSVSNVKYAPAEEFPEIPKVTEPNISLSVKQFKEMVRRVAFASSNDGTSVLGGVLLKTELNKSGNKQKLVMFATNGFHLSYEENTDLQLQGIPLSVIVRGVTLEMVSRTLPDEGELEIQADENKVLFHCDNIDIVTQIVSGNFPDYNLIKNMINNPTTTITVSSLELLRACRQLRVFSKESGTSIMNVQGMVMQYSMLKNERGGSEVSVFANKSGEDIVFGINVHYLHEFLEICETDKVSIELKGNKGAIVLRMNGYDKFFHIIMPIVS